MRIVVVRHAEKEREGNEASVPISERGRDSARACGVWLREQGVQPVAVAYTSAVRTRDTAALILEAFPGTSVQVLQRGSLPARSEKWEALVARLGAAMGNPTGDLLLCVHGGGQKLAEKAGRPEDVVPGNNRCGAYILNVEGGNATCVGTWEGWAKTAPG